MAVDRRLELMHREAVRSLERQAARVDEVRGRMSAVLGASSVAASVLGVTGEGVGVAYVVSVVGFVVVAVATALVLRPYGWTFQSSAKSLGAEYVDADVGVNEMLRFHAEELESFYDGNVPTLNRMYCLLEMGIVSLLVQILALLISLATRG